MSQSTYTPSPSKPKKPILPWVLLGCGVALVALIAFVGVVFSMVVAMMRSSGPYKDAMRLAAADARVQQALGTPLEPGWFVSGSIHTENESGDVNLSIPIRGPKGKAHIQVVGTRQNSRWTYSAMTVTPEKGEPIDLLNAESESTAPPTS